MSVQNLVEEFRVTMGQDKNPDMQATLIEEEYKEWYELTLSESDEGKFLELKELADLIYVIYGYANSRGWDLDEAVRRVHNNNLNRCIWPTGQAIRRREDGKIIKNPNASKIDLWDLI